MMTIECKDKKGNPVRKGRPCCRKCDSGNYAILTRAGGHQMFKFTCNHPEVSLSDDSKETYIEWKLDWERLPKKEAVMNNYLKHFRKELEIMESNLTKGDNLAIKDFIPEIESITEKFSNQGHSGASAPFYSGALSSTIKKVLSFEPLSPLTGEDSEWNNTSGDVYQNKRLSSVFKEGKNGAPYYLNAIVWDGEEEYDSFTGTVENITSRQFLEFPFKPKTFRLDVVKGNDEEYKLKDKTQLEEVYKYYLKEPTDER